MFTIKQIKMTSQYYLISDLGYKGMNGKKEVNIKFQKSYALLKMISPPYDKIGLYWLVVVYDSLYSYEIYDLLA